MRDLLKDDQGVVAVIFAVMAIPFIALAGWGVDYLRLHHVRDFLQVQADSAALGATMENDDWELLRTQLEAVVRAETIRQYGTVGWAEQLQVRVERLGGPENDFRVTASASVPLTFMHIVPGIPEATLVSANATARLFPPVWDYEIAVADLDYEAGDYNRIWAYCFWPNRPPNDPEQPRRTQMVPIADNGGPAGNRTVFEKDPGNPPISAVADAFLAEEYEEIRDAHHYGLDGRERGLWRLKSGAGTNRRTYLYVAPMCTGDSYLSFRLENVRFARTAHQYWDSGVAPNPESNSDGHTGRFDYYTDTYRDPDSDDESEYYGHLRHPVTGQPVDILETVLCATLEECRPVSEGGIIPEGNNRQEGSANPRQRADRACRANEYMYYGWEDRPPGQSGASDGWGDIAWTDADFDDIRVIVQCPVREQVGNRNARLIG